MSTNTLEALMLDEPESQAEEEHRARIQALDPEAVYRVVVAQLAEQRGELFTYIALSVAGGERWMPTPHQALIGRELQDLLNEAIDDLAGMVQAGGVQ